jgi:hypothetical protein
MQDQVNLLENIKNRIDQMNKTQHIEILKILLNCPNKVKLNENKSGVYVNLSFLPKEAISNICEYIDYVRDQESSLTAVETQKQSYKKTFFES